ncbi:MAG: 30S ribosomal protein S12 methylthiotransferase RimO [Sphingomonadales bacterium]|jgi:ribosomal protein S12 methylthiotransferase|nr:30S ribosomal protein S12 methylthiotransferase RimO [Sphingomonadales bacterium]MBK6490294.1 30S ribosomal protein S12 methylthiotransferase RimO [Sphingomonadales bacterium]MBK6721365.1 30S ribosomal protein S12 methylthiotransferase RimO [Sphingomonadales bacterium]MBK8273221.1 30S ribosomal protein S12 methylthiotransferase RimO [Sphingomonadales bacterium]MBK8859777.1 30S ribosomal protein S12 methylthiotransferase RimO [Sphingomonadales bacterium]
MAITLPSPPKVGMVSLGCPKALVDSERILTKLRADGYGLSPDYAGADVVLVNTCGFLDSAKEESLEAIGEAIAENGRVIVTGCMGNEADVIRARFPEVLAISGPHQYEAVVEAVHEAAPTVPNAFVDLVPEAGLKLTPRHYSYLKISEGCNHACAFCIIPSIRGGLVSRRPDAILREAEKLVAAGTRELLVISQDTSAYGVDIRHQPREWKGREVRAHMTDLAGELGRLGAWVRLHYVYPYPHVDQVIPLMAEGLVLPYLDIPFQHAAPSILKAMKRPANEAKVLERIRRWREICPDIAIRSTFVVGFPGETEGDFQYLLDWLDEAQLDRVGAFRFEPVEGAPANALPDPVPETVKEERYARIMEKTAAISAAKLAAKVGLTLDVIIDEVDADGGATGRSKADAPEIDGSVFLRNSRHLKAGDIAPVIIEDADEHDLYGAPISA